MLSARTLSKIVVVFAAVYIAYIGLTCPCGDESKGLYRCHLSEMYIALAIIITVLVMQNGMRLQSW